MERTLGRLCVLSLLCFLLLGAPCAGQQTQPIRWYSVDGQKNVKIYLYLFYSQRCAHCQEALRFVDQLERDHSWLEVVRYETTVYPQNLEYYRFMATSINRVAGQVPAFFHCKQLDIGYDSYERNGRRLENALIRCHDALTKQVRRTSEAPHDAPPLARVAVRRILLAQPPVELDLPLELPEPESKVDLPWWGEVEAAELSLPLITVVIAGCDAFNPCAFFVLLFLLSLMVHAHSRWRMLVVGGVFVFASAFVYFLFMAAWLNLFFIAGHLRFITVAAGGFAVVAALINVKDYFWFKQGVSLSIPEDVKPGLFQRMTRLVGERQFLAMLGGTIVLAGITNLYELLCTSGFPMIYTRVLTLRQLPLSEYYLYLVFYNLIYVLPLALIVVGFTFTLGSRKLTEDEGRVLKLLSGTMMLILGVLLLVAPELMTSLGAAIGMLLTSIGLTACIILADRWMRQPRVKAHKPA